MYNLFVKLLSIFLTFNLANFMKCRSIIKKESQKPKILDPSILSIKENYVNFLLVDLNGLTKEEVVETR